MDLFDIGQDVGYTGQVKQVKILGALALNDGGETDWKVLGIDVEDPIASLVDSMSLLSGGQNISNNMQTSKTLRSTAPA